ncbi:hypothetical protein JCM11491_000232 [Sporobolomyces phaffii]
MSTPQRLYRTLHDQLEHALYPAALKTTQRILRADPHDALALATEVQLLLALERFPAALQHDHATPVERAYALYKSARAPEARALLHAGDVDLDDDRAARVLLAQVDYRQGDYEASRDGFDDLANTADVDSPELDDLHHNSETCSTHLAFLSSVPSRASTSAAHHLDDLESRPLALVLPAQPRVRPTAPTLAVGSSADRKARKPRTTRPLKRFDADKVPVEDRWIPKRQRPSMRDQLLQNKEKARGRKKDKVALTQGSAAVDDRKDESNSKGATLSKAGGGGGANKGGGKKKKGKK